MALAQGCSPLTLTGILWPGWRAWTSDIDRGLVPSRLESLAKQAGIDADRILRSTLKPVHEALNPLAPKSQTLWHWVLAYGARNRRRFGGLQHCPQCLAEDQRPYFRKSWRLAWHISCSRHGCLLIDHCQACFAPLEPHRSEPRSASLCLCPTCGQDLRQGQVRPAATQAQAFQSAADAVFQRGKGAWAGAEFTRPEWFSLAYAAAMKRRHSFVTEHGGVPRTGLAMMLQRTVEREARLAAAFQEMMAPASLQSTKVVQMPDQSLCLKRERRKPTTRPPVLRPRSQSRVQGDWIRFLRRRRFIHP